MRRLALAARLVAAVTPLKPAQAQTSFFAIEDAPRVDGVRLNHRDRNLERVRGVNVTIWRPSESADGSFKGDVQSLAIGLPATAAPNINGIARGWLGAGAYESMRGITIGGVGVGTPTITGEGIAGIAAGGVDITGALVAPFGQGVFWLTELGRPQGSQASVSDSTDETGPTSRQPSVR